MINVKHYEFSLFRDGKTDTNPYTIINIQDLFNLFKSNELKNLFNKIRKHQLDGNEKLAQELKGQIPNITTAGIFTYRNNESIDTKKYTYICAFDIDYKENMDVNWNELRQTITSNESVIMCCTSPRGQGLKGFIQLHNNYKCKDQYIIYKNIVYPYYEKLWNVKMDYKQGVLSQPFFCTYDPNIYINYSVEEMEFDMDLTPYIKSNNKFNGKIPLHKKDYMVLNYCDEISELIDNKWSRIGEIGFTLGGMYITGNFSLTDDEIKNMLKQSCDQNTHIIDINLAYKQVDLTFSNGCENPLYNDDENVVSVTDILDDVYVSDITINKVDEVSIDFNNTKKFLKSLSKMDIKDAVQFMGEQFSFDKTYEDMRYIMYPVLRERQLGMIFGTTGDGKSVFAFDMAIQISNGKSVWKDYRCDCPPQKVLYIDFELGCSSISNRYKKGKFGNNFILHTVDNNAYNNYVGFDNPQSVRLDRAISFIEQLSFDYNSKVIFIDNLSNIADQVEQAAEADRFISDLFARMKELKLTIIFIGHTPKIDSKSQITVNQLKGSSSLSKTFEVILGFKRSLIDDNLSYVKQLKERDVEKIFTSDNVSKFIFESNDEVGWTLHNDGTDIENNLLGCEGSVVKQSKYDDEYIFEVLYDYKIIGIKHKELLIKYNIPNSTLYRFNKKLVDDKEFKIEYDQYVKDRNSKSLFK